MQAKTRYLTEIPGKGRVETWFDGTAGQRHWVTYKRDTEGNLSPEEASYSGTREGAERDHEYAVNTFEDGWGNGVQQKEKVEARSIR